MAWVKVEVPCGMKHSFGAFKIQMIVLTLQMFFKSVGLL